jgi:adenylate kinase
LKDKKTEEVIEDIERKSPETIILLGAPGSGKDTQAESLQDALGYQIISTGNLMRILAGHNDKVRDLMTRGELIPDSIVEDELISAFILLPEGQPVILDGYPRNLDQAKKLNEILKQNNRHLDKVILIDVTEKEAVKRISVRKLCSKCGNISSEKGDTCSECGGRLSSREDDKPASVKKRFLVFSEATKPMIDYYKNEGVLAIVDGNPTPDKVRDEIKKVI